MSKNVLIANAWPYANGSLHLGHIVSGLPSDILARYHRLKGDNVLFVSGSDTYGTPISVAAEKAGQDPVEFATKFHREFVESFKRLGFTYDNYSRTNQPFHHKVAQNMFTKLLEAGLLEKRSQELPYCPTDKRFLPDRYIEGICPICNFENARGDQCDNCGNLLDANSLVKPKCKIDGSTPIMKETEHFFLLLTKLEDAIKTWVSNSKGWRSNALGFTKKFLEEGLIDRAVTRDTDFGVPIPLDGYEHKRIYVWFEAVCGYLSASQQWAEEIKKSPEAWKPFWAEDALHYYVHGKDNIPFHTVIWPGILIGVGGLKLPDKIFSSEYLTLEGKKLSTSRNWAVWIPDYLESGLPVDSLRYVLIISGAESSDADFQWKDFGERHNKELLNNLGNFVNRTISFTVKNFGPNVPAANFSNEKSKQIIESLPNVINEVGDLIELGSFRAALQRIMKLSQQGNQYLDEMAPWKTFKEDKELAAEPLHVALQMIHALGILLDPFLPNTALKIRSMLKSGDHEWHFEPLAPGQDLSTPEFLFQRIEPEVIEQQKAKLG